MTNREWLMEQMQNMSDEELGRILDLSEYIREECEYCCNTDTTCDKCNACWLKAEHKEKPKISDAERVILENLDKEYKWIARDDKGGLYLYQHKPYKKDGCWWDSTIIRFEFYNHLFQFIKWEDENPHEIAELLKGE